MSHIYDMKLEKRITATKESTDYN